MAWMEHGVHSKDTHLPWKWPLELLGALRIMGETAILIMRVNILAL